MAAISSGAAPRRGDSAELLTSAIEAQTAAAPKSISDPNQRAALDRLRQKFQAGLQEFKSRGKDIYKLPVVCDHWRVGLRQVRGHPPFRH